MVQKNDDTTGKSHRSHQRLRFSFKKGELHSLINSNIFILVINIHLYQKLIIGVN